MKRAEIEERLLNLVKKHFEEDIHLSDSLIYEIGADSLDLVELLMKTEQEFNMHFDDTDFANVDTVQEAANVLCRIIPAEDYKGIIEPYKPQKDEMWERLYEFMKRLNRMIERYPLENNFEIEMDVDLFEFCNKIGFIPDNGYFKFQGRTFVLC